MGEEHKLKLAGLAMILATVVVLFLGALKMVLVNKPLAVDMIATHGDTKVEFHFDFDQASENNKVGE